VTSLIVEKKKKKIAADHDQRQSFVRHTRDVWGVGQPRDATSPCSVSKDGATLRRSLKTSTGATVVRSYNTRATSATSKAHRRRRCSRSRLRQDETPLKASTAYDVLVIIGWLGYDCGSRRCHKAQVVDTKSRITRRWTQISSQKKLLWTANHACAPNMDPPRGRRILIKTGWCEDWYPHGRRGWILHDGSDMAIRPRYTMR